MKILKKDIVIIGVIIVIATCFLIYNSVNARKGTGVEITVSGKLYKTFPIDKDGVYEITNGNEHNTLVIKNGKVNISEATCKNQVCVKHKSISKANETIICVPNKVVVKIVSDSENELDGVAK